MIIDKEKLIFIHIPKNAGTSIRRYFGNFSTYHETINDFKDVFPNEYNSYKKFTIVRNPYDRMVSWYFYIQKQAKEWVRFIKGGNPLSVSGNNGDGILSDIEKEMYNEIFTDSFIKWVLNPFEYSETRRQLPETSNYDIRLKNNQYTWIDDTVKVLKYENLNEELSNFLNRKIELPHLNSTKRKNYLKYYNKNALDIVYKRYKEDFKRFNYKKIEKI
tara:strand:+ start:105 stop:755 length:651 start_codon:yes stop_codon:yes gene_type:complete